MFLDKSGALNRHSMIADMVFALTFPQFLKCTPSVLYFLFNSALSRMPAHLAYKNVCSLKANPVSVQTLPDSKQKKCIFASSIFTQPDFIFKSGKGNLIWLDGRLINICFPFKSQSPRQNFCSIFFVSGYSYPWISSKFPVSIMARIIGRLKSGPFPSNKYKIPFYLLFPAPQRSPILNQYQSPPSCQTVPSAPAPWKQCCTINCLGYGLD